VTAPWRRIDAVGLAVAFAVGILIRAVLLPTQGFRGDMDQFVGWVHHIATHGLATLYQGTDAGPVTFGPVMAYIWGILAAVHPAFATTTDASDTTVQILMKLPASLADLGLAALVVVALRDRPRIAVLTACAVLLVPVTWYVSAWWGQYESIYVLSGLGAAIAATRGRNGLAAALIAISLSTKPQAIPFLIPFAAWFWAAGYARDGTRGGVRELVRTGLIGFGTLAVVWLPFLAAGGPIDYVRNLSTYQNEIFAVLSLRAWNAWWLFQEALAGGAFVRDDIAFLGPLTLRHLGFIITGVLELVIALAIVRDVRPRTLVLGLAASVLVFFTFMTQMHERYAYAALIFLVLWLAEPGVRRLWAVLAVCLTLDVVAAIPATDALGSIDPVSGPVAVVGSVALVAVTVLLLRMIRQGLGRPGAGRAGEESALSGP
jgi:Gpi18-like mannosyltransferase